MEDVQDLTSRSSSFLRWKAGTCLECLPIPGHPEITFLESIGPAKAIDDLRLDILDVGERLKMECQRYVQKWSSWANFWTSEKKKICEGFVSEKPTLSRYYDKFSSYQDIVNELKMVEPYIDIYSLR